MKGKLSHVMTTIAVLLLTVGMLHAFAGDTAPPVAPPNTAAWVEVADNAINQFIVDQCKALAENPDAEPNCKGKCISALHVCCDEQTGVCDTGSNHCQRKLLNAIEACFP